ncbi:head GIN domain-containing protein [Lacibacter sp. H407]|uniref:head GIN domain-containing protein n=1 Tax=Lacibacter sp. H407 TaxID=3133423 RepID=UPI0030C136E5
MMRKQIITGAVLLFIFSITITSCGWRSVKGNGDIVTVNRNEGSFKSVKASGSFDVFFSQADETEIRIEADENLMKYILTSVEDGVLKIRTKSGTNIRPSQDIKVYIKSPRYSSVSLAGSGNMVAQTAITSTEKIRLSIAGSGDIKLMEVNAPEVHVNIAGSGKAEGSGATRVVDIEVAGSGDVMMKDLKAETAKINIAGSGNVWVFASLVLDVRVAGGGDIHYYGNPADIKSKSAGSGNLIKE